MPVIRAGSSSYERGREGRMEPGCMGDERGVVDNVSGRELRIGWRWQKKPISGCMSRGDDPWLDWWLWWGNGN